MKQPVLSKNQIDLIVEKISNNVADSVKSFMVLLGCDYVTTNEFWGETKNAAMDRLEKDGKLLTLVIDAICTPPSVSKIVKIDNLSSQIAINVEADLSTSEKYKNFEKNAIATLISDGLRILLIDLVMNQSGS